MKILHFIYDHINNPWVGGGGAVRAYKIYKRLSQKGHEIKIMSGKYPDIKDYTEGSLRISFVGIDKNRILSTFSYIYYARQFLKKNYKKYDVVIEDFAPWNPLFSYRLKKQIPIVLQLHHREGYNILKKYNVVGVPFFILEKFYPRRYANVVVVSKETKTKYNISTATIISNGVDEDFLKINSMVGSYIAYIGRIDFYNKGLDILLNANIQYALKLAGRGKDEKLLNDKLKSRRNISYWGFVSEREKVSMLANSKFLVMPSRFEGQGIVALEAAALGKPVIISDIPELKYVEKNGFGISFASGDSKDMEKKIQSLWNNDKLVEEMGKKGRVFAENHTWDRIAEEYENYLIKILKET